MFLKMKSKSILFYNTGVRFTLLVSLWSPLHPSRVRRTREWGGKYSVRSYRSRVPRDTQVVMSDEGKKKKVPCPPYSCLSYLTTILLRLTLNAIERPRVQCVRSPCLREVVIKRSEKKFFVEYTRRV